MAFTVQGDGSAVLGANSFATVEFFRALLADRNIDTAAYADQAVQGALVEATDYQDRLYPWIGWPTTDAQNRLGWPRSGAQVLPGAVRYRPGYVIPDNVMPLSIQEATVWFALARLESGLPLAERRQTNAKKLKVKKIGPIEKTWASPLTADRFPTAEQCLNGLWWIDNANGAMMRR